MDSINWQDVGAFGLNSSFEPKPNEFLATLFP